MIGSETLVRWCFIQPSKKQVSILLFVAKLHGVAGNAVHPKLVSPNLYPTGVRV